MISATTVTAVVALGSLLVTCSQQAELILRPFANSVRKAPGSFVLFRCEVNQAEEGESYSINWFDNSNQEINDDPGRIYIEEHRWGTVSYKNLYITNIETSDEGAYTCTADIDGRHTSKIIRLLIFKDITFDSAPAEQTFQLYTDALIECRVSGNPEPTVTWRFNNQRIVLGSGTRFEADQANGLYVKNITQSDQGVYICRAEIESEGRYDERRIKVYILDPPRITLALKDQKVVNNGIVSFICIASGSPTPDVYWRTGGKRVNSARTRYTTFNITDGSVLRIDPVRSGRDDVAVECVVDNGISDPVTSVASLDIYPEDQDPIGYPRITEHPTLTVVEKHQTTLMTCSATGSPDPFIFWLKDNIPVDLSHSRIQLHPEGSLQVQNCQETDEGKYECVAENRVGVTYSIPANLYIRAQLPHFTVLPPESIDVNQGDSVNLTCVADGSPMPLVQWRHGATDATSQESSVQLGSNVLILNHISRSDTYTCVATSELGSIEHDVVVTVKVQLSTCGNQISECYTTLYQYVEPMLGPTLQVFIDNIKLTPLATHCRHVDDLIGCLSDVGVSCGSDSVLHQQLFVAIQAAHTFVCSVHLAEINKNLDCLVSVHTYNDYESCTLSIERPTGICSEEKYVAIIGELTACVDRSFTVRVNNGSDGCHKEASNLIIDFINHVFMDPRLHPCPGSDGQQRASRNINQDLWKKKILKNLKLHWLKY